MRQLCIAMGRCGEGVGLPCQSIPAWMVSHWSWPSLGPERCLVHGFPIKCNQCQPMCLLRQIGTGRQSDIPVHCPLPVSSLPGLLAKGSRVWVSPSGLQGLWPGEVPGGDEDRGQVLFLKPLPVYQGFNPRVAMACLLRTQQDWASSNLHDWPSAILLLVSGVHSVSWPGEPQLRDQSQEWSKAGVIPLQWLLAGLPLVPTDLGVHLPAPEPPALLL